MSATDDVAASGPLQRLDATAARRWAVLSRAALAAHRRELDALNVFPVPDGDTGTNLFLTLDAAMDVARGGRDDIPTSLPEAAEALAAATLLAARGNSGVILSQIVRGLAEVVAVEGEALDGQGLARALARASELASASVSRPAPGTILSVASKAAAAAAAAAEDIGRGTVQAVSRAALETAREALAATMAELPELTAAGVVDAGAAGYVLLLQALEAVVSGEGSRPAREVEGSAERALREPVASASAASLTAGSPSPAAPLSTREPARPCDSAPSGGPSFEVMFLISGGGSDAAETLRHALSALGDSVVVAGGAPAARAGDQRPSWHVHAHVDDVGAAIEAGMLVGRPRQIRVTSLTDDGPRTPRVDTVGVAAWAAGPGLATLFAEAGAVLIGAGPHGRPTTSDVLEAVQAAGTSSVLVLPNDKDVRPAADTAVAIAADRGTVVHVVRSRAAVQGIAAMAVFEAAKSAQDNLVAMASAAAATRHGAVMIASRLALTTAGWCYEGDVLGIVDDDIVTIGTDLASVAAVVIERLLGSGGEILTVVAGQDAPPGLAAAVGDAAHRRRRDLELTVLDGGQPLLHLLIGVE